MTLFAMTCHDMYDLMFDVTWWYCAIRICKNIVPAPALLARDINVDFIFLYKK